jgi:curved DNA-binding protein CbpA
MNREMALQILGLTDPIAEENDETLKKTYRTLILKYHPDKNKSEYSAAKFQEVREAYAFLQTADSIMEDDDPANESYDDILRIFLSRILEKEYAELAAPFITKMFELIFARIAFYADFKSAPFFELLRRINRPALEAIYSLLSKYREAFHLPEGLFEKMDEVMRLDEYIVLNPTLDDMFSEENVYKLKYEDRTYLVPLWHHDMTFDHEGRDLVVKCFPSLPDHIEVDEWNNLTVYLRFNVADVWNREVEVEICHNKSVKFDGQLLRLTEEPQTVLLEGCGLICNNVNDIFDSSVLQNILLIIQLRME